MIVLARKCITHAYAVNQKYFAARVSEESSAALGQLTAAIEDVSNTKELPSREVQELTCTIMPYRDSPEACVPGWVALLDAVGGFVYRNDRNLESLSWIIASAYQSVSNRACAEFHGVDGNCGFMDDEKETEEKNGLCAREIAYQIAQLAAIEGCPTDSSPPF
jgi:hypothetical protein